ncbi:MAG: hypothetical protein IJU95_04275 [Treponema sp.]|nr:hypothetical protein [Treponema sp.]
MKDVFYHYRRDNKTSLTRCAGRNTVSMIHDKEIVYDTIAYICSRKKLPETRSLKRYIRFLNAWVSLPYINNPYIFSPVTFRIKSLPWNFYSLRPDIFVEELFAFLGIDCVPSCIVAMKRHLKTLKTRNLSNIAKLLA